jgi:hypothetical protein
MPVLVPVAAPVRQARLGGIRSVATWVENARIGAANGVTYQSNGCTFPALAIGLCFGETTATPKTSVGIDEFEGIAQPFALYGGVECFIGPDPDQDERARRILLDGEDRNIEFRLADWADAATNIGPSVGGIVDALARLEQHADNNYLGRPIMFMSRSNAVKAHAAGALEYGIDGLPYTVNGTPVVASGRITDTNISVTGAVTVLRSAVNEVRSINPTTNKDWAVAEAVYALLVDCNYRATSTIGT